MIGRTTKIIELIKFLQENGMEVDRIYSISPALLIKHLKKYTGEIEEILIIRRKK